MIAIIDYGMGNLRSVFNAFQSVGVEAVVTRDPEDLRRARGIVLPGVGAFGDGMHNLREAGFVTVLEEEVRGRGKPFLGLCLGMQLMASTGLEHGRHAGLNWIQGVVDRIPIPPHDLALRVPHIGWNDVRLLKAHGLVAGLGESETFYFVHSFVLVPEDLSIVSGVCSYGIDFPAIVESGNLFGTQFHPEKSHRAGITILQNFATTCG